MIVQTTPLTGTPDMVKKAQICYAGMSDGHLYPVCILKRETFWNEEYQYIFEPLWDNIDSLRKQEVYININGLDLDTRKSKYYRVNMEPQFLLSRTPSSTRSDLHKLLRKRSMTYYDRMEYLIRSTGRSCIDHLVLRELSI